jgi:hypothetical protein
METEIRTASERQIAYYQGLAVALGEPATEGDVESFAALSVAEASERLTELEKRREEEAVKGGSAEEPK